MFISSTNSHMIMRFSKTTISLMATIIAIGSSVIFILDYSQSAHASSSSESITSGTKNIVSSNIINIFPARASPTTHALAITSKFHEPDDDLHARQLTAAPLYVISPHTLSAVMVSASVKCDQSLWNHIYHSYRLQVISPCITISGTIDKVIKESDGDSHIRFNPDSQFANLTNQANVDHQYGDLVLEAICQNPASQPDAITACTNFNQSVNIPTRGTHVNVTGSYVLDSDHGGWAEIHPITSITVDRR